MKHAIATADPFPARPNRRAVGLLAFLVRKRQLLDAKVTDLSHEACRIETDEYLKAGERRELRVARRGIAEVEIRRSAKGEAGTRFID